jgi:hypothetical protein
LSSPEKITIDKSGANKAAAASFNVVQRKRKKKEIAGIEIMRMIHKGKVLIETPFI